MKTRKPELEGTNGVECIHCQKLHKSMGKRFCDGCSKELTLEQKIRVTRGQKIDPKGLEQALMDADYTNSSIEKIVRAVNSHEELLRKLNDARRIIVELTVEAKDHKNPSGRYCDKCTSSQIWPCSIVRGYYEAKAIDEAIAVAEAK